MDSFKTPKGTELPFLKLQGKNYLQVMHRLVWFREDHPDWSIVTTIVHSDDKYSIVRAEIAKGDLLLAVAHKREDAGHFKDHLEKAETGAIGRALALCGYGTQFAPELDEHDRIVDSPVPPRRVPQPPRAMDVTHPPKQQSKLATEAQLKRLFAIAKSSNVDMDTIHAYIERTYGLKSTKELDWKQYNAVVEWVQLPDSDPFADVIEPKSDYENMRRDNVWKPDQN